MLLIRHARSADVVPGSPESLDPPLHDDGVRQVAALAARLAPKRIDAVYASHLRRAVDTAAALADPRGLRLVEDPDLQEVLLGEWGRGEFRRRAAAQDPEWLAGAHEALGRDPRRRERSSSGAGSPGPSSGWRRHIGETIAVVAHGGVINAYLAEMLGMPTTLWLTVENTSITSCWRGRGADTGVHVVVAGDCHHLHDPVLG